MHSLQLGIHDLWELGHQAGLLICRPVDCQIRTSPRGEGGRSLLFTALKQLPGRRVISAAFLVAATSQEPARIPLGVGIHGSLWQAAVSRPPPCFLVETLVHRNPHLSTSGTSAQQAGYQPPSGNRVPAVTSFSRLS
jgi:hypothetical protein